MWQRQFRNRLSRGTLVAALISCFLLPILWQDSAHAQSATCQRLERQLVSLSNSRPRGAAAIIKSQRRKINRSTRQMTDLNCHFKKPFFARERHRSCKSLRVQRKRLINALHKFEASGGGAQSKQRHRIKNQMLKHGCGQDERRIAARRSIMDQIFGLSEAEKRRKRAQRDRNQLKALAKRRVKSTEERLRNYKTVRTMCVRTCDGYYFPVSFSTKQSKMGKDAEACSNLCPGRSMELYYHKTTGQSAEDMISAETGAPYTELANAFSYRKEYNPACSCNYRLVKREKATVSPEALDKLTEGQRRELIGRIAKPSWRAVAGDDPESIANNKGDFTPTTLVEIDRPADTSLQARSKRVRIIGDSYFPNQ